MEYKKISELKSLEWNPRRIDQEDYEKLLKSLRTFPKMLEFRPLVIDEDNVILGWNQRLKALTELWFEKVPIKVFTKKDIEEAIKTHKEETGEDVDEEYIKWEFIIRDNIQNGHWDYELLRDWDADNLNDWWLDYTAEIVPDEDKEAIEDDVPETTENIIVEKWDIFQLWEHRLMCWDSTSIDDVEKLMNWEKADMVFTDPPYWAWFNIKNDKPDEFKEVFDLSMDNAIIFCNNVFLIACYYSCIAEFIIKMRELWFEFNEKIVWVKNLFWQWKVFHRKHEDILFFSKWEHSRDFRNKYDDAVEFDSVRNFMWSKNAKEAVWHPTQKPVELLVYIMRPFLSNTSIILDLFWWSWSTLIASEKTNRKCYMMELDEKYIQVILKRYNMYTDWRKEIKCLNRDLDLSTILDN